MLAEINYDVRRVVSVLLNIKKVPGLISAVGTSIK